MVGTARVLAAWVGIVVISSMSSHVAVFIAMMDAGIREDLKETL